MTKDIGIAENAMPEKIYSVVDYPISALQRPKVSMRVPSTASFGVVKPEDVILSPNGGIHLYQDNAIFPSKGLRTGPRLFASEVIKKYIKSWLVVFSSLPWQWFDRWLLSLGSLCESQWGDLWLTEQYLSPPVQEIRRVLLTMIGEYDFTNPTTLFSQVKLPLQKFYLLESKVRITNTIASILEVDPVYRWKTQDALGSVDWIEAVRKPSKAVRVFMNTLAERDHARSWKAIGYLLGCLVFIWPKARRFVKEFAIHVDSQRLWFDEADLYYNLRNGDDAGVGYDYLGLSREQRYALWEKITKGAIERMNAS